MKKTLIIAHRGYHETVPENSLEAFEQAYQRKADGIELDVRLTKDKKVIVHHDPLSKIQKKSYDQFCSLEEVLLQFGNKFKIINIEIKSTDIISNGIEKRVYELIQRCRPKSKIRISSFNPLSLMKLRNLDSEIELGYLISPQNWYTQKAWAKIFLKKNYFIHLDSRFIDFRQHHQITQWDTPLWIWTVNNPFEKKWCLKNPFIAGIITDFP